MLILKIEFLMFYHEKQLLAKQCMHRMRIPCYVYCQLIFVVSFEVLVAVAIYAVFWNFRQNLF
jgi:hypothetical protein